MKRILTLLLAALLLGGCAAPAAPAANPTEPSVVLEQAVGLLQKAPDEIWLYQDELKVNTSVEPYLSPQGLHYYPVTQFKTLAELQAHSRQLFTQDFCDNVLNAWSLKPEKPRFIELNGQLWECKGVGGMGWVQSLLIETAQLAELNLEENYALVDAFSQSLLGPVTVERFRLELEDGIWRLDSYYHWGRQQERVQSPSAVSYLQSLSGNADAPLMQVTVTDSEGKAYAISDEAHTKPFYEVLAAVEYRPGSELAVDAVPTLPDNVTFGLTVGETRQILTFTQAGELYITLPDSSTVYRLELVMSTSTTMLRRLLEALKWNQRLF